MKSSLLLKLMPAGFILSCCLPVSILSQVLWHKYENNPVMEGPDAWYDECWNPQVIEESGTFKMWFSARASGDPTSIGYAESTDGIDWVVSDHPVIPAGMPGSWDRYREAGNVINVNDTLKMWYSGSSDDFVYNISIGYAWSVDNIEWHVLDTAVLKKGEPGSWEETGVFMPCIHFDGETYHMWYHGFTNAGPYDPGSIGYATSPDGINWTRDTLNNPVLSIAPQTFFSAWIIPNCVLYLNDEYQLWFTGKSEQNSHFRIGYANSADGINWTVQNDSLPVLNVGLIGEWDDQWVCYSSVIFHDDMYKMWYHGRHMSIDRIGYATQGYVSVNALPTSCPAIDIVALSPNPCSEVTCMQYKVAGNRYLKTDLFGVDGRMIRTINEGRYADGIYRNKIDVGDLPAGIYFVRMQSGDETITKKMVIHR